MLNFEVSPSSAITAESLFAIIFATIIFIAIPIALVIIEYRITKKEKKHGPYLILGTFASALLLGVYSLFVALLLLIVYWITPYTQKNRGQINENEA